MKFKLTHDLARQRAIEALKVAPFGSLITIREGEGRTDEQNRKLWPLIRDVKDQVDYYGYDLSEEQWKEFFVAIQEGQILIPSPDRIGFIAVGGKSSSKLSKKAFSEVIEIIYCFGAERGVKWKDKSHRVFDEYRVVA